jgi:hypothetical protein
MGSTLGEMREPEFGSLNPDERTRLFIQSHQYTLLSCSNSPSSDALR